MNESSPLTIASAAARVQGIWEINIQTHRMDSEHDGFRAILQELQKGKISPEEAVAQANKLAASRQEGMTG